VHLSFKCFMCGMKNSLRSKITPMNLVSSTTGGRPTGSYKKGSMYILKVICLFVLNKCIGYDTKAATRRSPNFF